MSAFSTEPAKSGEGRITRSAKKILLTTTNPFEKQFGYHRAVRRGPFIFVSGTTAVDFSKGNSSDEHEEPPKVRYPGDPHKQAVLAMQRCQQAVRDLGGKVEDVVRVKMFVAKYENCGAVEDAYKAVFAGDQSSNSANGEDLLGAAATMIVVPGGFVDEDMLVEVEVDAYCY